MRHFCRHSAFVALANLRYINALNNNNNNNNCCSPVSVCHKLVLAYCSVETDGLIELLYGEVAFFDPSYTVF